MFHFLYGCSATDGTPSNTEFKAAYRPTPHIFLLLLLFVLLFAPPGRSLLQIGLQYSFNVSESDTLIEGARTSTPVIIQNINITGAIEAIKAEWERERDKGRDGVVFLPVELFVFRFIRLPAALPARFT